MEKEVNINTNTNRTTNTTSTLQFGFVGGHETVFNHLKNTLILPKLLAGGAIIKGWYCTDCNVTNKKGESTSFNQLFGCIDESNVSINGWNKASANLYDDTQQQGILLKCVTFMM